MPLIFAGLLSGCNKPTAEYFNKTASSRESMPNELITALEIKSEGSIADIGAGGGYFTIRFSEKVHQGIVYAVDVNPDFLKYIERTIKKKNIKNVKVLQSSSSDSMLPDACCDLIFLRNVFHHLPSQVSYFKRLKSKLKKDGRIAIVENKKHGFLSFIGLFKHYTQPERIQKKMNLAGYQRIKKHTFLKKQSFQVFQIR